MPGTRAFINKYEYTQVLFLGQAIIIPPLQTIQMQMSLVCKKWGISHLNLADMKNLDEISNKIDELNPKIILCSIEDVSDEATQRRLQKLDVAYVAVDECQVMDPVSGWCEIRPYCSATWKFICASFKWPFFLLSATMEELSLQRVLGK